MRLLLVLALLLLSSCTRWSYMVVSTEATGTGRGTLTQSVKIDSWSKPTEQDKMEALLLCQ